MMSDNYSHNLSSAIYTPDNIPGPGCPMDLFSSDLAGCNCTLRCQDSCDHLFAFGRNYDLGLLMPGARNFPVFECNDKCDCNPALCHNRLVQFGPCKSLEVVKLNDVKGLGVVAKKKLVPGEFVVCYAGEVLGLEAARARTERQTRNKRANYIIVVREHSGGSTIETIVDPTMMGNIGRYINHSCDPNLVMVPIRVDCMVPNLALFARRDVAEGEEITFNYAGTVDVKDNTNNSRDRGGDCQRIVCFCESDQCEGYLPFDPALF